MWVGLICVRYIERVGVIGRWDIEREGLIGVDGGEGCVHVHVCVVGCGCKCGCRSRCRGQRRKGAVRSVGKMDMVIEPVASSMEVQGLSNML
jgi:hypothetical protein